MAGGSPATPQLRLAPVVGDLLIVSSAGCWRDRSAPKYNWSGPLEEVPGAQTIATEGFTIAAIKLQAFMDAVDEATK